MLASIRRAPAVVAAFAAALAACSSSSSSSPATPPTDEVEKEIVDAVLTSRPHIFQCGPQHAEVTAIRLGPWTENRIGVIEGPPNQVCEWTAKLRFKEPFGVVVMQVDGTKVVRVLARAGDELEHKGNVGARYWEKRWHIGANDASGRDAGPWTGLWEKAGPMSVAFKAYDASGERMVGRGAPFRPVSTLAPYVEEGSTEMEKLMAAANERNAKAQEAAQAEAKRRQEEAAEKQRVAAEAAAAQQLAYEAERKKAVIEAAEKKLAAVEAAAKNAEEARHAKLLPTLQVFKAPSGLVVTSDAGIPMGSAILQVELDETNLNVKGTGLDLREMPFREFTFEGTFDARGALSVKTSLAPEPAAYVAAGANLTSRAIGATIAPLSEADRAKVDAIAKLGKSLQGAAPAEVKVEILDAAAVKAREPQLALAPLAGTVLYRGKNAPTVAPLFAGGKAVTKAYAWKSKEVVALRLNEPAKGSGLYFRGSAGATEDLTVVINGVHRAAVPSIPKGGAAILSLPAGVEILDVRFEAGGAAQSRGIALIP